MNGLRGASDFYPEFGRAPGESEGLLGCLSYAIMLKFIGVGESPAQILVENTNSNPDCARFFAGRVLVDDANSFRSSVNESQLGIACVVSLCKVKGYLRQFFPKVPCRNHGIVIETVMLKHLPRQVDGGVGYREIPKRSRRKTLLALVELADFPLEIRALEERRGFYPTTLRYLENIAHLIHRGVHGVEPFERCFE